MSESGVIRMSNKREENTTLPSSSNIVPHYISILILHHKVRKPIYRLKMKANYLSDIVSESGVIGRSNKREIFFTFYISSSSHKLSF